MADAPFSLQLNFERRISWQVAYGFAIVVAGLFLTASLLTLAAPQMAPMTSGVIALVFAVLAAVAAVLLVLAGGVLTALPYFVAGSALFFGVGTFIAVIEPASNAYFTLDQQAVMLPRINTLNAAAVFVVLLAAAPLCWRQPPGTREDRGAASALEALAPLAPAAVLLAFPVHAIEWVLFPLVEDEALRAVTDMMAMLPLFALFLTGVFWDRLRTVERVLGLCLLGLVVVEGLLSLSKLTVIMPALGLGLGFWLGGRFRVAGIAVILGTVILYFQALSLIAALGRGHVMFDPYANSVAQRAQIVSEVVTSMPELVDETDSSNALARFSPTQFSAFFVNSFDQGFAGDTLRQAAIVLVPRLLWEGKPEIAPGREFDGAWRGVEVFSSLAIGFPSEAYWNGGWWIVLPVSAYIGLMLGWFTRKWFLFRAEGLGHIGLFVFGAPVMKSALWVESNIVGSYVGGWIKMAILIMAIDLAVRMAGQLRAGMRDTDAPVAPLPRAQLLPGE